MSRQSDLNKLMTEITDEYLKLNEKQQRRAIRELKRINGDMADLLADFVGSDGTIQKRRLNRLLREMDAVKRGYHGQARVVLGDIITESTEWTTQEINGALITVLGAAAISLAESRLLNRRIERKVWSRKGDDLLNLSDRVWNLANGTHEELTRVVRQSINRGESINEMMAKIRQTHANETWKIRRLAWSEGVTAHRTATGENAKHGGIKYVKLIDGSCRNKNHYQHRCYILANEDKYGKGMGIYKPTDEEIYSPHPQCTSYIEYVLDEEVLRGAK